MKTAVKELSHKGSSSTVEWTDDQGYLKRVIVPSDEVIKEGGLLYVEDADEGQDYGVGWENLIHTRMGPKVIANLLRKSGIWTVEDYANNSGAVTSAFNEACSANLQQFKEAVLNFMSHKEEE